MGEDKISGTFCFLCSPAAKHASYTKPGLAKFGQVLVPCLLLSFNSKVES